MKIKQIILETIESNKALYKPTLFLGMLAGSLYLNAFLSEFGVPFPLDIGVLPTMLLVIGMIAIFLVSITAFYVLLISFINEDPMKSGFHRVINTTSSGLYSSKLRNYLKLYTFTYILPYSLFFYLLLSEILTSDSGGVFLIFLLGYTFFSFLYSYFISKHAFNHWKEKIRFARRMTLNLILFQAASLLSLGFFVLILVPRVGNIGDYTFLTIVFAYLIVNMFCLMPIFSKDKFFDVTAKSGSLTADKLITHTQATPVPWVVLLLVLLSFLAPFSTYVGELPLKILNIGGGSDFVAVDGKRQCNSWPNFIISNQTENSCTTKTGKLIIQLGDRAYAVFDEGNKDRIVSLNLSKSAIVNSIPENSLYLRNKAEESNKQ